MRRSLVLSFLVLVAACAGPMRKDDPLAALRDEIASLNESELFACGQSAFAAEEFRRSALCFGEILTRFVESPRWRDAAFNAGAAHEKLGEWELALDRYRAAMAGDDRLTLDALFRAATALYHLDRYAEAIALLEPIADDAARGPTDRIRARTHAGICKLEGGDRTAAEVDFRAALEIWRKAVEEAKEPVGDYFPGQAQFFLGELYRLHFEDVRLDAVDDKEKLAQDLEYKAQLLLSAQGHYLRTIRMGNVHWGTAAGTRVGQLYEQLYDEMMEAPVPSGLDEEQARLYRGLLRRRVRVLVQKAIAIYERTLGTAERLGTHSAFVEQTRESLERMKRVLVADAARDEAEGIREEDLEPVAEPET